MVGWCTSLCLSCLRASNSVGSLPCDHWHAMILFWTNGCFHKWGYPKWMVYKDKSIYKWMRTGGTPILGNPQILPRPTLAIIQKWWESPGIQWLRKWCSPCLSQLGYTWTSERTHGFLCDPSDSFNFWLILGCSVYRSSTQMSCPALTCRLKRTRLKLTRNV